MKPSTLELREWPREPLQQWPVHADYVWGKDEKGNKAIEAVGPIVRRYDVSQDGGLLAKFLNTCGAANKILDFVKHYGLGGFRPALGPKTAEALHHWERAYGHLRNVEACVFARNWGGDIAAKAMNYFER